MTSSDVVLLKCFFFCDVGWNVNPSPVWWDRGEVARRSAASQGEGLMLQGLHWLHGDQPTICQLGPFDRCKEKSLSARFTRCFSSTAWLSYLRFRVGVSLSDPGQEPVHRNCTMWKTPKYRSISQLPNLPRGNKWSVYWLLSMLSCFIVPSMHSHIH